MLLDATMPSKWPDGRKSLMPVCDQRRSVPNVQQADSDLFRIILYALL